MCLWYELTPAKGIVPIFTSDNVMFGGRAILGSQARERFLVTLAENLGVDRHDPKLNRAVEDAWRQDVDPIIQMQFEDGHRYSADQLVAYFDGLPIGSR